MNELFLDNNCWTPQTFMLRSISDFIMKVDGNPISALSIDHNPTLEQILKRKWPQLIISYAQYPQCDAQNLHQFADKSFDIVFSHQVLEHIPKPWLAAKEMVRVLKKEGIGIHTSCAYNPRHGYPAFKDYYRFLPDGLAELFEGVKIWIKDGWGSREALIYNLTIDDGYGALGGRRFVEALGKKNEENFPWVTWVMFQKIIDDSYTTSNVSSNDNIKSDQNRAEDYSFNSELSEQKLVKRLVKPGMTVFDVGAHIGKYSVLFGKLILPQGKLYSFEPTKKSYDKLVENIKLYDLGDVKVQNLAVYNQDCELNFNEFPEEYSSWNSLGKPVMENPKDSKSIVPIIKTSRIKAVSLDSFCQKENITYIDYLKIDVEGAEIFALQGAKNLLTNKSIKYIQFEISQKMLEGLNTKAKDLFDYLKTFGYHSYQITESGELGIEVHNSTEFYVNYVAMAEQLK